MERPRRQSIGSVYLGTSLKSLHNFHVQPVLVSLLPASFPAKPTTVLDLLLAPTLLAFLLRSLMLPQLLGDP